MRIDASGRVLIGTTSLTGISSSGDDLVIGSIGDGTSRGLTFATTADATIRWADAGDNAMGRIQYVNSTDIMTFHTSNAQRLAINAAGQVGINTTPTAFGQLCVGMPSQSGGSALQVMNSATGGGDGGTTNIVLRSVNSNGTNWAHAEYRAHSHKFLFQGTTKVNINTNGLCFNTDTAADNALSDYEEGTFTPNNTIGMPLTSNFPAQYVKIGNLCWIMMDITFNSSPADTSQCGLIQNLPFTAKNLTNGEQYVDFPFISESGSNNLDHDLANTVTFIEKQGTAIKIFNFGLNAIQQRAFLAGRRMRFNFCYRTE